MTTGLIGPSALTRRLILILSVAILFGALAHLGVTLTRDHGRIAAVWLPNAMMVAVLMRRWRLDLPMLAAAMIANVAVNLIGGDAIGIGIGLSLVNGIEILVVCLGMRALGVARPDMEKFSHLLLFCLIGGIAAPVLAGALGAMILERSAPPNIAMWLQWALTDSLGMLILAPAIWVAGDAWAKRAWLSRSVLVEWVMIVIGGGLVVSAVFAQSNYPLLYVVTPVVLLAAFRLGAPGAVATTLMVAIIASIATGLGSGPISLARGDLSDQLHVLQGFLTVNFGMSLPVAAALAGRASIARALNASEQLNRSILDNMREVIFKTDAAGRWVSLNPAWEALTGYSVGESLGWMTTRLLHREDLAAAAKIYPQIVSGELPETVLRQRFHRKSGDSKHIEVSVRRLSDATGRFLGTIGNIRDISDIVMREDELAESERRFQALANLAPAGIFRTDADGRSTYVNAAWLRLSGLGEDEWRGGGWARAIHPDDYDRVNTAWREAVAEVRDFRAEFRWVRPDGSYAWVDALGRPEVDEHGVVRGFIGVNMDVTQRRQIERELIERDAQLSLLANNATDAVFRLTLDGHCLYASPSARDLIGIDPAQLLGAQMLARFHPDERASVISAFDALARGEIEARVIAYRSERFDQPGSYSWLEAHCGLVRDPATGAPREIIASIRDVSANKALEEDLRLARRKAEGAAAAKSSFLATMSHEIRTPMNGVIGFTDLLLSSDLSGEQRGQVQMIADSGRSMMRLLNDILDISKIESGQMQLADEPVDLRHKLKGCIQLMEPVARGKGVVLRVEVDDVVPLQVRGDPHRLRQIMLNLIGNAVKFTEVGAITARARLIPADGEESLRLEVEDSGIGIPGEQLGTIFQKFSQGDSSIARRFGGSGLGLSITADLVALMGGEISVQSKVGKGTCFSVTLPLRAVPVFASPANETARVSAGDRAVTGAPRILVAEDHDINQALVLAIARQHGFDATIAADGAQAIAMVDAAATAGRPYALVLMDVQMPVVDGLEATRRLRASGYTPERLPIVALTANAYPEDIAACVAAGMQAHLGKPFAAGDLAAIVATYVGPTRPGASEDIGADALNDLYRARRVETMNAVATLSEADGADASDVVALANLLHKLAGTAGLFGDAALGKAAGAFERALRAAPPEQHAAVIRSGREALSRAA